jgi:hypothetical protein
MNNLNLQELDLSNNKIKGPRAPQEIQYLNNLQFLDF